MVATPINNTLYEYKQCRLATANEYRIEPNPSEPDILEVTLQYYLSLGAGQMERWKAE